ncbi:hypothetical protein E2C01_070763 [Portunus trituberculatus]|uniref:Uncharacterized protein n=1 Tax=Portunus trituberculatus TaxID=210409 RepID=A0A5B7I277_PORTR|nr:hypothetical protein [Portunus trituberculatus]
MLVLSLPPWDASLASPSCGPKYTPTISRRRAAVTASVMREMSEVEDIHIKWCKYITTITEVFHRHFPAKDVAVHLSDFPWATLFTKKFMRHRNWAFLSPV